MTKWIGERVLDVFPEDMKRLINESRIDGREHGFKLCKDEGDVLSKQGECVGTECEIGMTRRCTGLKEFIGNFHTHPAGYAYPSFSDADWQIHRQYKEWKIPYELFKKIICLGAREKGKDVARCFETEDVRKALDDNIKSQEKVQEGIFEKVVTTFNKPIGDIYLEGMKAKSIRYAEKIL
jgi:hypothetical protein